MFGKCTTHALNWQVLMMLGAERLRDGVGLPLYGYSVAFLLATIMLPTNFAIAKEVYLFIEQRIFCLAI
jgi:hypothetical protein